ncbi:MAG: CBS domain-containing protein [Deltaproteobacteria bacterium]|nr:CBS domain-containing protein [Deltaproteobacteria bacterium]MBW2359309.1 CBS domain-containing protein [Deltaproteobacteria bacterium]
MQEARRILTARDIMATSLVTFRADQLIYDAIKLLLKHGISGAPVVDDDRRLIGILSELDCLRMLSSDEFLGDEQEEGGLVEHFMSTDARTIEPEVGVYRIAHCFMTTAIRRLPVLEDERLIGQVSRRDVLNAIDVMHKKRLVRRRFPDYREPA